MYLAANLRVWIFDSLSEGRVGMIFLSAAKASLRFCVLCLSRTLANTLCVWTSWCWSNGQLLIMSCSSNGLLLRWWWLLSFRCLWLILCCCCCSCPWWLMLLPPLWSDPQESESKELSERRFRPFTGISWILLWRRWWSGGDRLPLWSMWFILYCWWWWPKNRQVYFLYTCSMIDDLLDEPKWGNMPECCCCCCCCWWWWWWWRSCSSLIKDDKVSISDWLREQWCFLYGCWTSTDWKTLRMMRRRCWPFMQSTRLCQSSVCVEGRGQ